MVAKRSGRGKSRPGVYQRRGRWYWTINVKDPVSGQWRKKWSHAFDTQEAAWNDRVEVQRRQERGEWTDPGRLTVGEYLDRWQAARPVGFGMRGDNGQHLRPSTRLGTTQDRARTAARVDR